MKLKHRIITMFLLMANSIYAQNTLYSLKATPVEDPYLYRNEIPAALFKYDKDSMMINEAINLATYENRVKDIRYYYESKRIIILKETKKGQKTFGIINSEHFDNLTYKPVICPKPYEYSEFKMVNKRNQPFLCIECFNKDLEKFSFLKGINLVNYLEEDLFPNDYTNIILSGATHYIGWSDYQDVSTEPTNGNIRIPVVRNINERPIFPLVLPDSLQLGKKMILLIILNNQNQLALHLSSTEFVNNQIGSTTLIIYDYNKQKWYKQQLKGNYSNINSYGKWLAGVVYDYTGQSYNDNKESPGKDVRVKLNSQNEFNADIRFYYFNIYSPGILYLFNTYTQKYIEWNTGQGDSEILLVEDDKVYYRVNDEIYKASILKGEKLGKPELLIKGPQVLDIHWAFISK